ncbi:MAG: PQQ-binding-like beta-propeller repeat protein [Bacteroidia bacterium]|nr:PQQ-binding-like beta-propeller repeat protein [Bacteroidia bacterium]
MKNLIFVVFIVFLYSCSETIEKVETPELAQWRGDNRDGNYNEKDLLKLWPANGPVMVWCYDSIGSGYGSPAITSDMIFVNGAVDSIGYLFSFNLSGKLLWKSAYGKEWMVNFEGSRSTPTVSGKLVYVCSGLGEIVCFDKDNGTKIWSKNMISDFHGKNIDFGFSESLLIDDSTLFATPGGKDTNIVAIDRFNGTIKWISKAKSLKSAYCSPILINLPVRKIMVTFTENEFVGIDCSDGKLLWSQKQDTFCLIHGNTPVYEDGFIYYSAGCGNGTVKLKLSDDGSTIKEIWKNTHLINYFSGVIKFKNKIYGASEDKNKWVSIDATSGKLLDSLDFKKGVTIYADSMLYCYNEKGQFGLVDPNGEKMQLVSSFKIIKGSGEHFSHPVIKDGILYVRHGKSLMAYKIKK